MAQPAATSASRTAVKPSFAVIGISLSLWHEYRQTRVPMAMSPSADLIAAHELRLPRLNNQVNFPLGGRQSLTIHGSSDDTPRGPKTLSGTVTLIRYLNTPKSVCLSAHANSFVSGLALHWNSPLSSTMPSLGKLAPGSPVRRQTMFMLLPRPLTRTRS